jgi:hypothetical protein
MSKNVQLTIVTLFKKITSFASTDRKKNHDKTRSRTTHNEVEHSWFLGTFAKLRKTSVRTSIRMEQLGSHRTRCSEILHICICSKSIQNIQISLKSHKNIKVQYMKTNIHILS